MNGISQRWIGSCRREATDRVLITGQRHLRLIVCEYADRYNRHRPHRSLGQHPPDQLIAAAPRSAGDRTKISRLDRLVASFTKTSRPHRVTRFPAPRGCRAARRSGGVTSPRPPSRPPRTGVGRRRRPPVG
ncbi:integrase core domain-containing protein [Streptomyces asiaticus]